MLSILRSYNIASNALLNISATKASAGPAETQVIKFTYVEAEAEMCGSVLTTIYEGDILHLCEVPDCCNEQNAADVRALTRKLIVVSQFGLHVAKELLGIDYDDRTIEVVSCETGGLEIIEFHNITELFAVKYIQRSLENDQNETDYVIY